MPKNGCGKVLKGERVWLYRLVCIYSIHHGGSNKVRFALMCVLFGADSFKFRKQKK